MELSECMAALQRAGIKRVAVTWDTDSVDDDDPWDGEGLRFFTNTGEEVTDTLCEIFELAGDTKTDLYDLDCAIDTRFCDIRNEIDQDWDQDDGSRGKIVLHVQTGEMRCDYLKYVVRVRQSRHSAEFAHADLAPTTIYRDPDPEQILLTVEEGPSKPPASSSEPACNCTSLLQGHAEKCPWWRAQQGKSIV